MPQPIQSQVIQLQQQPSHWTRMLANLMTLANAGMNVWSGLHNQQQVENQKGQAINLFMQGLSTWGGSPQHRYQAMIASGLFTPEHARAIIDQDIAARGQERKLNNLEGMQTAPSTGQQQQTPPPLMNSVPDVDFSQQQLQSVLNLLGPQGPPDNPFMTPSR